MVKSLATPGKYFQGFDILDKLHDRIGFLGEKFLLLSDEIVFEIVKDKLAKGFSGKNAKWDVLLFDGESTLLEAERIAKIAEEKKCEVIIGIGGGKIADTAKLVAEIKDFSLVIIPTSVATNAPCSAMSVIYDEAGKFLESRKTKKHPDVVLVDTKIIMEAPLKTFIAGIGDAFACYYEARACKTSGAMNFTGGIGTDGAYAIAELCNKMLLEHAVSAKQAVSEQQWSVSFEKTVEAIVYLSAVGFENNGCAIAHGIYSGMTAVLAPFPTTHGEAVAVGVLVQLVAEKIPEKEWDEVIDFYRSVGLPTCLEDLGIQNVTDELLSKIGESACTVSANPHKMPFVVTPKLLFDSLKTVQERKRKS